MADRPILFSGAMVRALLVGRKTQTRRVFDFHGLEKVVEFVPVGTDKTGRRIFEMKDRFGRAVTRPAGKHFVDYHWTAPFAVGDRLYVREAHALVPSTAYRMSEGVRQTINPSDPYEAAIYRLGWERSKPRWGPGIHMPRWASRITLIVTDVRVQRLQEINEADAIAEGVESDSDGWRDYQMPATQCCGSARDSFRSLWGSLNEARGYGWEANPWVVAVTFTVHQRNINEMEPVA